MQESQTNVPENDPTQGLLQATLELRSDLKCSQRECGEDRFFVIEDPVRNKFFRAGEKEYLLLLSLNGQQSVRQAADEISKHGTVYSDEELVSICKWLIQNNLVNGFHPNTSNVLAQKARMLAGQKWLSRLNPICFKVRLFNPDGLIQKMEPWTGWVFGKAFFALWFAVAFICGFLTWTNWERMEHASVGIFAPNQWFWLILVWLVLKIVHELAHGVACRRYGGEVREAGVLMLLFTPMAYVDVTSCWRFPNRWHRMIVTAAGMYIELFLAFSAFILWAWLPEGIAADLCFNVFTMGCIATVLFNANPLMRFDGYYLLSDGLGIPNLYPKGVKWFGERLRGLVFGTPVSSSICSSRERVSVAIYGVMAFVWKILISVGLVIAASVMLQGFGLILGLMGVVLWFGLPLYRQLKQVFSAPQGSLNPWRLVTSSIVIMVVAATIFTVFRGPAVRSAPALVQFKDEIILRAESSGFIESIFVHNGQSVDAGDKLIRLRNVELETELLQLRQQVLESKVQSRIHRQALEFDKAIAEDDHRTGLQSQLKEKQTQVDALTLVAPKAGVVFQPDLEHKIGSFAAQGDVLLSVIEPDQKEVILSIDETDLESLRFARENQFQLVFPGCRTMSATLSKINPRASDRPSHWDFCANYGGTVPVKAVVSDSDETDDGFHWLSQRLTAELEIGNDCAQVLQSGQRGQAYFRSKSQSLGSYLFLRMERWLSTKIEQATQTAPF